MAGVLLSLAAVTYAPSPKRRPGRLGVALCSCPFLGVGVKGQDLYTNAGGRGRGPADDWHLAPINEPCISWLPASAHCVDNCATINNNNPCLIIAIFLNDKKGSLPTFQFGPLLAF